MPRIRAENIAQHKAQTRTAILDAAEQAFAARAFDDASLGLIADLAGLPRSTLYDYFPSREALVAALIAERVPPLISEWMAFLTDGGPMERLEGFFTATFSMAALHPQLTSALLGAGRRIPRRLHTEFVPIVETIIGQIRALVVWGIETGAFIDVDPDALAAALTDLLAGGIDDIVGRDRPKVPMDDAIAIRLALMRAGVKAVAVQA